MKKAGKITLYTVLALFFLLGIFHDYLIRSFIQQIFTEKSKGRIELDIESFHLKLHYGTIVIINPTLKFNDYFINNDKSLKLESIGFKKVKIEAIDLMSLIFKKEILAGYFYVEKPEFFLSEHGKERKTEIQPEGFMTSFDRQIN